MQPTFGCGSNRRGSRLLTLCALLLATCTPVGPPVDLKSLFDTTRRDLGGIRVESDYTANYRLTNTTDRPLVVTKIETSCGCVAADYDPSEIEPGSHRDISLNLSTHGLTVLGPLVKHATVSFAGGERVQLSLQCMLESDFDVEPRRLEFSADTRAGKLTLNRRQLNPADFARLVLVADADRFDVAEDTAAATPDHREFQVSMKEASAGAALPDLYFASEPGGKPYPFSTVVCHRSGPTLRPSAFVVVVAADAPPPEPQHFRLVDFQSQPMKLTTVEGFDEQARQHLMINFDPDTDPRSFVVGLAEAPDAPVTNLFVSVGFESLDRSATGRLLLPCHIVTPPKKRETAAASR